ncbi:meiosis-specific nuclear structural protein 1-like, partial [Sinocyclocheilus anshuiensis]|uniref:meiosis-specific nuclear structural protein 1-like n=1 Tax=Sinocyclocheilus anshuiensis TaxID=1608454 RepID=UPI0007B7BEC9
MTAALGRLSGKADSRTWESFTRSGLKPDIELRELELKLKSAYLNRERAAQMAEKESMRYETMRQEIAVARKMKDEHELAELEKEKQEQKKYEEVVRYQQELERQLEEKDCKRQEAYEEFLKEKLMVDEIVWKIYEEDQ